MTSLATDLGGSTGVNRQTSREAIIPNRAPAEARAPVIGEGWTVERGRHYGQPVELTEARDGWPTSRADRQALDYIIALRREKSRQRREEEQAAQAREMGLSPIFSSPLLMESTDASRAALHYCRNAGWVEPGGASGIGLHLTRRGHDLAGDVRRFVDEVFVKRARAFDAVIAWASAFQGHTVTLLQFRSSDFAWFWTVQFDDDELSEALWRARYVGYVDFETKRRGRIETLHATQAGMEYTDRLLGPARRPNAGAASRISSAEVPGADHGVREINVGAGVGTLIYVAGNVQNITVSWQEASPHLQELAAKLDQIAEQYDDGFRQLAEELRAAERHRKPDEVQSVLERVVRRAGSIGAAAVVGQLVRLAFDAAMATFGLK